MFNREVIYEVNVRAFSMLNKNIKKINQGKILGLCDDWSLKHYKELGVTVIQVMPIMKNDINYAGRFWGYHPVSLTELNSDYGTEAEFKETINTLHKHGFKVICDSVINHTGTKLEGLDYDHTDRYGCGCPVSVNSPNSLVEIKKAVRYLLDDLKFDGIRWDLGGCLLRMSDGALNPNSPILEWLGETYSKTKIFSAECYDLHGNYRHLFPSWMWRISNSIRDQIRDQKQYLHTKDGNPEINIGFVCVHDGMVLRDLTEYSHKYNEANGEDGRDGTNDNKSFNCGVEGKTDDPQILAWRQARADSMLRALYNYTGHVMLYQGDVAVNETGGWVGRMTNTQWGNNNSYRMDNKVGWVIWDKED